MKDNSKKHHRKSIRLSEYDYSFPNWYYITIGSHERGNLFGEIKNGKMILNKIGLMVEEEWLRTKKIRKYVELGLLCDYAEPPSRYNNNRTIN